MKAKFGAIVVDGRGKIGGHVASKNKAGSYFRTKTTPANPRTGYQSSVRADFGALAQSWRGLTQAQRDSWNSGAPNFPYTDIFGDTKILSGFGLYMQLNGNLNSVNAPLLTNCPTPATVTAASLFEAAVEAPNSLVLDFLRTPVPANHAYVVSATPSLGSGLAFSKSRLRQVTKLAAAIATGVDVGAAYIGRFGEIPPTYNIYVGLHSVLLSTGQVSPISIVSGVDA